MGGEKRDEESGGLWCGRGRSTGQCCPTHSACGSKLAGLHMWGKHELGDITSSSQQPAVSQMDG